MRWLAGALPAILPMAVGTTAAHAQSQTQTWQFRAYEEVFELGDDQEADDYQVTVLASNAPGHVFHAGEQPELTFQIENLMDKPLQATGSIEVIRYGTFFDPEFKRAQWRPTIKKLEAVGRETLEVDLEPEGWRNITIEPETPETKGGYALVVDLDGHGRRYLASYIRTFAPNTERVQYPKQSLEHMPSEILERLGVQAVRQGVPFELPDTDRREKGKPYFEWLDDLMRDYHEHRVTVMAEIGTGRSYDQPLGRGRPHLDENDVMQDGKQDLVWLPKHDDEFEQFVYELVAEYGWPKGPITGITIWNEPWEGTSISGWQADMQRYRELHRRMGDAVFRAREQAGVDVLVGGADSSSNTWDKFFGEGIEDSPFWPEYLDFCSIHYQGMSSPTLYKAWNEREHHKGRVLIWDTESWVANSEDRFLGAIAANRAAGYDRTMGSLSRYAVSTLSHRRVAHDEIRTPKGTETIERVLETRPLGAAYGAAQHFLGERELDQVLFKTGLPWVFVFNGLDSPDDGTVVVVGDIESIFDQNLLFSSVRSLAEIADKTWAREQLDALDADAVGRRHTLYAQLAERRPFTGVSMQIDNPDGLFALHDVYGNVVDDDAVIEIELNSHANLLRADPDEPGSFDKLLKALRSARIEGLQPVEIQARDMTDTVDAEPVVRLRMTNQLNEPVNGNLRITLGNLEVEAPDEVSFEPRERKIVDVKVVGGEPRADNTYALAVDFHGGEHGLAPHREDMHVNLVSRRTITVDGELSDWQGALPQTINVAGEGGPSFTERMWLPFEEFEEGVEHGFATAYVAYDDNYFYFAARVVDQERRPAPIRFGKRKHDRDFYPAVSYEEDNEGELIEHHWPDSVRRFSYRRRPDLPSSGSGRNFDNILLGFNVLEPGEDGHTISHLPGRMPKFTHTKTTDYQFALNEIDEEAGGGTEVFRLEAPGMPRKHFYPRQPEHPKEGPIANAKLEVVYRNGMRIVEAAIRWEAMPTVCRRMEAGEPMKFSYRVNHGEGGPTMELSRDRSLAEGISKSFHVDWQQSYPNELPFQWE